MAGPEEFGFISVDVKDHSEVLTEAMDAEGIRVISLGGTLDYIRERRPNLDIIHSEEFINNPHVTAELAELRANAQGTAHQSVVERECREIVAAHLAPYMSDTQAELKSVGRGIIRAVGINLMAPELVRERGKVRKVKRDKGGIFMIDAALEGLRLAFTDPKEYEDPDVTRWTLKRHPAGETVNGFVVARSMAATEYLNAYRRSIIGVASDAGLRSTI